MGDIHLTVPFFRSGLSPATAEQSCSLAVSGSSSVSQAPFFAVSGEVPDPDWVGAGTPGAGEAGPLDVAANGSASVDGSDPACVAVAGAGAAEVAVVEPQALSGRRSAAEMASVPAVFSIVVPFPDECEDHGNCVKGMASHVWCPSR